MPNTKQAPAKQAPARKRATKRAADAPDAPATDAPAPDAAPTRDDMRATAHALYTALRAQHGGSIPVKLVADFKPRAVKRTAATTTPEPTERAAAAVALAFIHNGAKLADGATTSRFFTRDGADYCIENGVLGRAITGGLITVSGDQSERIKLCAGGVAAIRAQLGAKLPADAT